MVFLGIIFIDTVGMAGHEVSLFYVSDPDKVYDWIMEK